MKKQLTEQQEFELMLLVLDKFLLFAFLIMAFGLYHVFFDKARLGLAWILIGASLLIIFIIMITKKFESKSRK